MRGSWRQLRALLITCALLLGFIAGWPEPGPRIITGLSPRTAAYARGIPGYGRVRVSQEQILIEAAGQGFTPTGRFDHVVSLTRMQVLP